MAVVYNPFEPGYIENPYPHLRSLRENDPVHHSPLGFWMLTRYEDINNVLRDTDRFSADHRNASHRVLKDIEPAFMPVILFRDPPDHTRLRKLLAKAFTPVTVEQFRPRLRVLLDGHLDRIATMEEFDFISEVASPLPFTVISELLGMPAEDRAQVFTWTSDIVNITEPVVGEETAKAILSSMDSMRAYLVEMVAQKRRKPTTDVLSVMAAQEDGHDGLSDEEIVDHVMLLHVSAHEPTGNHLGQGLLALLQHPEQMHRLRQDPALDGPAVEEILRFEAPLQLTGRFATETVEIGGRRIDKGTPVVMSLAAANHDPARWGPTADDFDLRRPRPHEHLSFARGVHTCFGSALARLQGQEVFGRLVRRFPGLALSEPPRWNGRLNGRGPAELRLSTV